MRSKQAAECPENRQAYILQLEKDIKNSIWHIFGHHQNCSSDFCKHVTPEGDAPTPAEEAQEAPTTSSESLPEQTLNDDDIMSEQWRYWVEGSSEQDMEDVRSEGKTKEKVEEAIIHDVMPILGCVAQKADQLICNVTSNLAESWMAIRAKFDGGKFFDRCKSTSWATRTLGAGLRKNLGAQWSPFVWEQKAGQAATKPFWKWSKHVEKIQARSKKSRAKPDVKARALERKGVVCRQGSSKKARKHYGEESIQAAPDISSSTLADAIKTYEEQHVCVNNDQRVAIAKETLLQSLCGRWHEERKRRITASRVGEIIRRKVSIKVEPLVHRYLYPIFKGSKATRHGNKNEDLAIGEYVARHNNSSSVAIEVVKTGLYIHLSKSWLAASPDGLVLQDKQVVGVVEVKNPLVRDTLINVAQSKKAFCLEWNGSSLRVKKGHDL